MLCFVKLEAAEAASLAKDERIAALKKALEPFASRYVRSDAGQTLHAMWMDDAFDSGPEGERVSFVSVAFLALVFWLAWPIVWGAVRSRKAYLKAKSAPTLPQGERQ